jgi:3-deoxy-D-manno-octulosonic-acid transferase
VAVPGTPLDRVAAILEKDNTLDYISHSKNNTLPIVVSSLAERRSPLLDFINSNTLNVKFIIAHNIKADQIEQLKTASQKKQFSEEGGKPS